MSKKAVSGKSGGLKGGASRVAKLTPEQRAEIARVAAQARWKNRPSQRHRVGKVPQGRC
jgi:hypothetical protein